MSSINERGICKVRNISITINSNVGFRKKVFNYIQNSITYLFLILKRFVCFLSNQEEIKAEALQQNRVADTGGLSTEQTIKQFEMEVMELKKQNEEIRAQEKEQVKYTLEN